MKEWTKPEMQELDFSNTEDNLDQGTVVDADLYEPNNGPFIRHRYSR